MVSVEKARVFRGAVDTDTTSYGADVLCRSVLEAASLAWWLLDPDLDAEGRLARAFQYRYHTACQTEKAVDHLGARPEEDASQYGELPETVRQEADDLGVPLTSPPRYTQRVAGLVPQVWPQPGLPYAVLSAVAHAELFGLARNLGQRPVARQASQAGTAMALHPVPDPSGFWLWHDAYLVSGALLLSVERAAGFLGLSQEMTELQAGKTEIQQRLEQLRIR